MNRKLVLLGTAALMTAATATAQKRVTGRVVDAEGQPVPGATVRVEGHKTIVITGNDGRFVLQNVPASARHLKVSYIGKRAQTVNIAGNVNVTLADDDNVLDEAVVVGYGTAQKLGTVVGSVKQVSSEKLADKPAANVADALQGKVSGLQIFNNTGDPGQTLSSVSIRLRGVGSLSASNTPLIIVDGTPVSTAMFGLINDKDIESISTLKDASATSIYGSRAANGVIFITTKRGRAGEKAQVTVSQKIGWSQLANSIGNPMNANELLDFQLENNVIQIDKYQEYKKHGANTDWQRYYFDNAAPMYSTDVSLRGGSETTSYYVSGSYLKQNSLTRVSHFKRYTLRTNLDTKPKSWLQFGIKQNIAYTDRMSDQYTKQGEGYTSNNAVSTYMSAPYWDPYHPDYVGDHLIYGSNSYDYQWIQRLRPAMSNDIVYNGVAYAQLTPLKGLTLRSQLGLYAADTRGTQILYPSMPGATQGWAYESHDRNSIWTITNTAEYKFKIGDDHAITLLAGQEGIKGNDKSFSIQGMGTTDDRLPTLGSTTEGKVPGYSSYEYQYLSFFGRADYALMNKYFLNLTVRNDQSSRFGSENRGATFVSGGLMWHVSDEDFMLSTKGWLKNLQLKGSVGTTGNSEIGNYAHLGLIGTTQYGGQSGWVLKQPSNKMLGWEKQIQGNFGLSANLFDKLTVDFNVYKRITKDMLMDTPLPFTTGFTEQTLNIGQMSNKGVELELQYDAFRTRDAFLSLYANYSYNVNTIDELFYGLKEWPMYDYLLNYKVGASLNYNMPIYAGVDKNDGAPMWYKAGHKGGVQHEFNPETMTKTYSDDLYQDTGKARYAPHAGGFGLTAGWKGFTLQADFSYVLGKYMVNNDYFFAASSGNAMNGFNQDKDMLNIWKKPGDITDLPGFQYDTQFDTHVLENASFLRLKNLSLSYDLPKPWMEASQFLTNVRLTATARNLFTVTKYRGANPELDSNLALGAFPATRQFTLGVEVTF